MELRAYQGEYVEPDVLSGGVKMIVARPAADMLGVYLCKTWIAVHFNETP
jgi:uncharacterized protein YodC (DUF2158 family)